MTVSSTTNRKTFAGDNATTSFGTSPVVFFNTSDLTVYVVTNSTGAATTLTENTHYTATGGRGSTGTVNLAGGASPHGALASGTTLVIVRDVPVTQAIDLVNNGNSDADVIETALDRLTMIAQQNANKIARAVALADSDTSGASVKLPAPAASKLIGWDSAGTALANYASATIAATIVPTAFMETVLDDTSAATARTTLGAAASGANTDITSLSAPALGAATATTQASSDSSTKVATTAMVQGAAAAVFPRSHLAGLTLSTAGSSATMSIAAGVAADSTNAALMTLAASIGKTTSAWAVGTGNGGLDTGAIGNNTWYHFYVIKRPDTGVVDVCFSLSASAPTTGGSLPSAYTLYRRIGSGKTNGSAQWVLFVQNGDAFLWDAPVLDVNATNPGTSAVTPTMSTPLGVITEHIGNWQLNDNSDGTSGVLVSSMLVADRAASTSAAPLNSLSGFDGAVGGMTVFASGQIKTLTDTSSRVRYRCYVSGGSTIVSCATTGWIDRRGKDS